MNMHHFSHNITPASAVVSVADALRDTSARVTFEGVAVIVAVVVAHLALLIPLIKAHDDQIVLKNTEPPASVRITMVRPTEVPVVQEPTPQPPAVLVSEKEARRTVASQPEPQAVVQPKPEPKPVPKPKPTLKPTPTLNAPTLPKVPTIPSEPKPAATTGPKPTETSGEKYLQLPAAGPKDVQSVGCKVPAPAYPRRALRLKLQGTVYVQLVIDPGGHVVQAMVAKSSGNDALDDAAIEAVKEASCNPYLENGKAIAVRATQPVSFTLK